MLRVLESNWGSSSLNWANWNRLASNARAQARLPPERGPCARAAGSNNMRNTYEHDDTRFICRCTLANLALLNTKTSRYQLAANFNVSSTE
jgi:hypothetical protein